MALLGSDLYDFTNQKSRNFYCLISLRDSRGPYNTQIKIDATHTKIENINAKNIKSMTQIKTLIQRNTKYMSHSANLQVYLFSGDDFDNENVKYQI